MRSISSKGKIGPRLNSAKAYVPESLFVRFFIEFLAESIGDVFVVAGKIFEIVGVSPVYPHAAGREWEDIRRSYIRRGNFQVE